MAIANLNYEGIYKNVATNDTNDSVKGWQAVNELKPAL